ncbi:hypothetical protein [Paraclostridium bifermentans]|uniref:hypothetical protein n=1 Tax=Paraclostridium bifermentans TaxID=1490 RepID=UPI001FF1020C|nr:hypothetical protein [Paraclostridium bifermentans]UOW68858.1 hypothetical protein MTR78_05330 [Paraclostridium bifermentans]
MGILKIRYYVLALRIKYKFFSQSCKDALNGYQRGQCFYCEVPINVSHDSGIKIYSIKKEK